MIPFSSNKNTKLFHWVANLYQIITVDSLVINEVMSSDSIVINEHIVQF